MKHITLADFFIWLGATLLAVVLLAFGAGLDPQLMHECGQFIFTVGFVMVSYGIVWLFWR